MDSKTKAAESDGLLPKKTVFAASLVLVLLVSAFPMLSFWAANAGELLGVEGAVQGCWPVLLCMLVGAVTFFVFRLLCGRDSVKAALLSLVVCFVLLDFGVFFKITDSLLPFLPRTLGALLLALVFTVLGVWLSLRLSKKEIVALFLTVFSAVLMLLSLWNVVMVIRNTRWETQPRGRAEEIQGEANDSLPNIYLFVADEMADAYAMEKYYDLPADENELCAWLEEHGFCVSRESYSYTNHTTWSTANLFSLDYVCDPQTTNDMAREKTRNGIWFREMEALGYQSVQASSHVGHYPMLADLTGVTAAEVMVGSITFSGETVLDMLVERSALSLVNAFAGEDGVTFIDRLGAKILGTHMDRVAKFYSDGAIYQTEPPVAVHTYLLSPHTPFFIDENGNATPAKHRADWEHPKYYRDQWLYTAQYLEKIFADIIENDPGAVIILQSDHGIRGGLYTDSSRPIDREDQCRIFNAVYMGGETFDIEGLSSVNTLRKVLTRLGRDWPEIEDQDFMYYQDSPLFATGD